MKDKKVVLGDAKDRNDPIYSNNDDYKWDNSRKTYKTTDGGVLKVIMAPKR